VRVRILITGGTFDKKYDELTGKLFFRTTHVEEMLRLGRCLLATEAEVLMLKDSLEMDDADRARIVAACGAAGERHLVVTHGTDTMAETARALGQANLDKTIVLTGAMVPYAFGSSDGLFNLGSALAFAQALPSGVYVAMNGTAFRWDDVRKNLAQGVFERIHPPEPARGAAADESVDELAASPLPRIRR
jgi:L-asparaginase